MGRRLHAPIARAKSVWYDKRGSGKKNHCISDFDRLWVANS